MIAIFGASEVERGEETCVNAHTEATIIGILHILAKVLLRHDSSVMVLICFDIVLKSLNYGLCSSARPH